MLVCWFCVDYFILLKLGRCVPGSLQAHSLGLDDHLHINMPSGQRLLDVEGLREKLQGLCQWRIDSVFLR